MYDSAAAGLCLFGEMIDNGRMTRAAQEVEKADVLIVLGANLTSPLCGQMIQYFTGSNLILVNDTEHYSDQRGGHYHLWKKRPLPFQYTGRMRQNKIKT